MPRTRSTSSSKSYGTVWSPDLEEALQGFSLACRAHAVANWRYFVRVRRVYNGIMFPTIVISGIAGTTGFMGENSEAWGYVRSAFMLLVGLVNTIVQFLDLSTRYTFHQKLAARFRTLSLDIVNELSKPRHGRASPDLFVTEVVRQYGALMVANTETPDDILGRIRGTMRTSPNNTTVASGRRGRRGDGRRPRPNNVDTSVQLLQSIINASQPQKIRSAVQRRRIANSDFQRAPPTELRSVLRGDRSAARRRNSRERHRRALSNLGDLRKLGLAPFSAPNMEHAVIELDTEPESAQAGAACQETSTSWISLGETATDDNGRER
jgi:hypothetical protein